MTTPVAQIVDAAGYARAVEDVVKAAAAYYTDGTSPLDDDTYDRLMRGITAWEADHPDQVLPDSPSGKVAGGAVEGDVPHTVAMLSLDNVFSAEQFTAWTASLARRIGHEAQRYSVEAKLDGLAIAARYTEGRLTRLITRGDGTAGEDVSHAMSTVEGLPETLAEPVTVEVRGEVLMTGAQFEHANEVRTAHGGQPFANPRNAAPSEPRRCRAAAADHSRRTSSGPCRRGPWPAGCPPRRCADWRTAARRARCAPRWRARTAHPS